MYLLKTLALIDFPRILVKVIEILDRSTTRFDQNSKFSLKVLQKIQPQLKDEKNSSQAI